MLNTINMGIIQYNRVQPNTPNSERQVSRISLSRLKEKIKNICAWKVEYQQNLICKISQFIGPVTVGIWIPDKPGIKGPTCPIVKWFDNEMVSAIQTIIWMHNHYLDHHFKTGQPTGQLPAIIRSCIWIVQLLECLYSDPFCTPLLEFSTS